MQERLTDDVRTLIGNPRKAVVSMALPILVSSLVTSCNNVVDGAWVSALGPGAMAAVGVVFPFMFIMLGLGNGIGVGASQAIARRIGAKDYEGTHRVAAQALVMVLVESVVFTAVLLLFTEPLLELAGAGQYMRETVEYAMPVFICTVPIMMGYVFTSFLRAEGAARRSMNMNLAGAVLNLVLDPIFIYGLGWGVSGAAWATAVSMTVSTSIGFYWYFVRKDTFVRVPLRGFRFDWEADRDILRVGIPAATDIVMISLTSLVVNNIILAVDPEDGIAVFTVGWRMVSLLMIPAMSLGNAMVPVCAAAYGARRYDKLNETFGYSVRLGTGIMLAITLVTLLGADVIAMLFTYGQESAYLAEPIAEFLRICCVFMPLAAFPLTAIGVFLGLGMGTRSLACTVLKSAVRIPVCAAMIPLGVLTYVWWGFAAAEIVATVATFGWAYLTVRQILRTDGAAGNRHNP